MPSMKMTTRSVRELPAPDPSGKPTLYWSQGTATPGLGILVSGISASKSCVCQSNLNGKVRRITLGPVAQLTIEEAWAEARPKLAAMLGGRDPKLTLPQRQFAMMTVAEILEDYLAASSNLRPATIRMYRGSAKHVCPLLNRTMREITAAQVEHQFRSRVMSQNDTQTAKSRAGLPLPRRRSPTARCAYSGRCGSFRRSATKG